MRLGKPLVSHASVGSPVPVGACCLSFFMPASGASAVAGAPLWVHGRPCPWADPPWPQCSSPPSELTSGPLACDGAQGEASPGSLASSLAQKV